MEEQPHSRFELFTTMNVRGQSYIPAALPQDKSPHFNIVESWLGLRTSLEVSEKKYLLILPGVFNLNATMWNLKLCKIYLHK